jgi:two-component sensor histidine kinase
MKIVIVDESPADRDLCRRLLKEVYGPRLEFIECENAATGLDTCRAARPDCVLVDYRLPDMTGIQFLAKLVAEEPSAAVVMLTALDGGVVAAVVLKAGAHDFLLKDHLTSETLHLAVEKSIQRLNLTRMLNAERDRLATSLAEKVILLKEVHHRVTNNLQVIASLLRMQTTVLGDEPTAHALLESQHRVESMAMIHRQLYESEDFREVDLGKHVGTLMANLFLAYGVDPGRIACQPVVDRLSLAVDQAIPVGLILNEFVSNALKHAFPDNRCGAIRVQCHRVGGVITLEVTDDGRGIPEGAEPRSTKSLGLEIVNILTHQLRGKFSWERETAGTTFRVSFPEQQSAAENRHSAASGT